MPSGGDPVSIVCLGDAGQTRTEENEDGEQARDGRLHARHSTGSEAWHASGLRTHGEVSVRVIASATPWATAQR
jgi:hypothetical protein